MPPFPLKWLGTQLIIFFRFSILMFSIGLKYFRFLFHKKEFRLLILSHHSITWQIFLNFKRNVDLYCYVINYFKFKCLYLDYEMVLALISSAQVLYGYAGLIGLLVWISKKSTRTLAQHTIKLRLFLHQFSHDDSWQ